MARNRGEITALLRDSSLGNPGAMEALFPLVYDELRSLARSYLRGQRPGHTLQATALVNEAYIRLVGTDQEHWESRAHFYRVAAMAMRRILVDHARRRQAEKRGGDLDRVSLNLAEGAGEPDQTAVDVLALDEALTRLAAFDEQKCRIVELRFFSGFTTAEAAQALNISPRSVEREWSLARAWLFRELSTKPPPSP